MPVNRQFYSIFQKVSTYGKRKITNLWGLIERFVPIFFGPASFLSDTTNINYVNPSLLQILKSSNVTCNALHYNCILFKRVEYFWKNTIHVKLFLSKIPCI